MHWIYDVLHSISAKYAMYGSRTCPLTDLLLLTKLATIASQTVQLTCQRNLGRWFDRLRLVLWHIRSGDIILYTFSWCRGVGHGTNLSKHSVQWKSLTILQGKLSRASKATCIKMSMALLTMLSIYLTFRLAIPAALICNCCLIKYWFTCGFSSMSSLNLQFPLQTNWTPYK